MNQTLRPRLSDKIRNARRSAAEGTGTWVFLVLAVFVTQLALGILWFLWTWGEGLWIFQAAFFPFSLYSGPDVEGAPALWWVVDSVALVTCFLLPPTLALRQVRKPERFPFLRTLGIHWLVNLAFYLVYSSVGWEPWNQPL